MTRAAPQHLVRLLAILLATGVVAPPAFAAAVAQSATPLRKLSRGLANSLTGVLAIPLTISDVGQVEGPIAALSWGLLLGAGAAITRTLIGLADVITFPIPLSTIGYEPLLQPEFLLQPEHPVLSQPATTP